jgi:hypothetical protein
MFKALFALSVLTMAFSRCKKEEVAFVNTQDRVRDYLSAIMDVMQENAVYKKQIDWIDFRKQVLEMGQKAPSPESAYPAIQLALTLLQDNGHSHFVNRGGYYITCDCRPDTAKYQDAPVSLDNTIGYIKIPGFSEGWNETKIEAYITTIQQNIKDADNAHVKGWIVDLRGNRGGHYGPMLQSIRPILGEGEVGYMISPDGSSYAWDYNFSSIENYELRKPNPKVAVLTDGRTASAGELIAIAFKGRPNTRSFGTSTQGVSTGRTYFNIDGEQLQLATELMADRTKKPYGREVYPDVEERNASIMVEKAVEWLKQ